MAADLVPLRCNLLFGLTTRSLAICTSTGAEKRCPAHHFILISLMRDTCRQGIIQSCNAALLCAWKVSNHVRHPVIRARSGKKTERGADDWGMTEDGGTEEDKGQFVRVAESQRGGNELETSLKSQSSQLLLITRSLFIQRKTSAGSAAGRSVRMLSDVLHLDGESTFLFS